MIRSLRIKWKSCILVCCHSYLPLTRQEDAGIFIAGGIGCMYRNKYVFMPFHCSNGSCSGVSGSLPGDFSWDWQNSTGAGFFPSFYDHSLLIIILPLFHTHLSLSPEMCSSPDQAAHYHILSHWARVFISDLAVVWSQSEEVKYFQAYVYKIWVGRTHIHWLHSRFHIWLTKIYTFLNET
jgi:hypothetical protein